MKHWIIICISLLLPPGAFAAGPKVELKTTMGPLVIELYPENAPNTVKNFLQYVNDGFYDGTIFHRVIPGFMAQGGGMTPQLQEKPTRTAIRSEAPNGLRNAVGTVAMARTRNPHSATAQFFINVAENDFLDFKSADEAGYGYTVFGRVVSGIDIVQKMVKVPTATVGPHQNVPRQPIVIERARVVGGTAKPQTSK